MTKKKGINIKPSRRGTFTAWCKRQGFKSVTSECIRKGLASRDSRIRKKANFARNARSWSHSRTRSVRGNAMIRIDIRISSFDEDGLDPLVEQINRLIWSVDG